MSMISMVHFDTLAYTEKLQAAGIVEKQAKAFARAQNDFLSEYLDDSLVTKTDLVKAESALKTDIQRVESELKSEIQAVRTELKSEIQAVRTELKSDIQELRAEVKSDIQELRAEVKSDIQELRTELKSDIQEIRFELKSDQKLHKWMFGIMSAGIGALVLKAFFYI